MRKSTKKIVLACLFLSLISSQIGSIQIAAAAGSDVTIVASGGAAQGTSWDVTGGVLTSTSAASINGSDISALLNSSDLVIDATSLLIQDSITSTSGHHLTLKSTANIRVVGGVGISTGGGNIVFQSDSDASGSGSTRLGGGISGAGGIGASPNSAADSTVGNILSGGGNIVFSGGLDVNTGYAKASSDVGYIGGTKPKSGVAIYGFNINAAGGNVVIRSHGGTMSASTRGLIIEQNVTTRATISTTGAGIIEVIGDGSTISGSTAWGIAFSGVNFTSGSGRISLTGKGNTSYGNARGIASSNVNYQSTSGPISLIDETDGAAVNYSGSYFGNPNVFSTSNTVIIKADELYIEDAAIFTLSCSAATIQANSSASFTATPSFKQMDATGCQELNVGATGNTSALTFASPVNVGGAININGAAVTLSANMTASTNLSITASGNVTQAGKIQAPGLRLAGAGAFTLNNATNLVSTLSAGSSGARTGSVSFNNSAALNIGTVAGSSGFYSSGTIAVSTVTGNLAVTQPISSSAATGDSVVLYANKAQASGVAGSGNITFNGSGALSIESGARALLYSGSRPDSPGLIAAVGGESNSRSLVDSATVISSISPAIATTGTFAFLRTDAPSPVALSSAEIDAATAAAVAKREEEKKAARSEISSKFQGSEKVSLETFKQADIAGVTSENIDSVLAEILALPEASRADINQILKVALKYEVVGKIASSQIGSIYPADLIKIGLIPADSKYKTALTLALKKLPSSARSTYSAIEAALNAEMAKIQARKDRLSLIASRISTKS